VLRILPVRFLWLRVDNVTQDCFVQLIFDGRVRLPNGRTDHIAIILPEGFLKIALLLPYDFTIAELL
jgi:hypothetical protein